MPLPHTHAILHAAAFAAHKHRNQRRKDVAATPYINHPLTVALLLSECGGVEDVATLQAALLHDVLEDTDTQPAEIEAGFGADVLRLVLEVTDDKSLPKQKRKELQIEHAATLSPQARLIKLADKIANVSDIGHSPPLQWSTERQRAYVDWARSVIAAIRGSNPALETRFDEACAKALRALSDQAS
ncbi:MAG TPA: phosphohydrolase [Verrucomicrobia bacterium]|nr:phosphohydrolase [Verrucomicrobiota bacterium]